MKKAVMIIITLLLIMTLFAACDGNGNEPPNNENGNNGGNDSWKPIEREDANAMFTRLLRGVKESVDNISKGKVNDMNPLFSIDSRAKVKVNDLTLWMDFKMNYNLQNPDDLRMGIEVLNEEQDAVVLGIYFYKEYLYIKMADGEAGELKYPLDTSIIQTFFPLEMNTFDIKHYSTVLTSLIRINGDITGRTRMYGHIAEYEYRFEVNLANTLERLVSTMSPGGILQEFDSETLSLIIQRIMGVSFEDISNGNIPESSIIIEFSLSDDKLTSFKADLLVDQEGESKNVLFGGDVINMTFDLEKLVIKRGGAGSIENFVSIPFFANNEHVSYPLYGDQSFGIQLNITQKGEEEEEDQDYIITGEVKLDLEEIISNELLFEIKDTDGNKLWGAYIYRNMFYIYNSTQGDFQKVIEFPIDIMDIYEKIREGNIQEDDTPIEKKDVMEYVAYFVGALRFHEQKLSFRIDRDFYDMLLPNFEEFFTYADEVLEDIDLIQELEEAGCSRIIDYLMENTFEVYIALSEDAESFIYIVEGDIQFPDGVEGIQEENDD